MGLSNLNLLPANVLESLSGESEEEIARLTARDVRVGGLVAKRKAKVLKSTNNSVVLDYDLEMRLREIGRADFDGDGIEDIFVASAKYATPATFRYFDYFILTRPNASAGFTVKRPDWLALGKDSAALSAGIDLKSSQLKKVKITRQAFKENWPFEVEEGELACTNVGSVAVFFTTNGKTYALNAWAKHSKIDGQPVSLDMAGDSNAAIFNQAFTMCKAKGEK